MRILFQGDSVTDSGRNREKLAPNCGLGPGYPDLIAAELLLRQPEARHEIFNRGISGNRTPDLYQRWKVDALNLKPDLISILIGVNDTWHEFGSKNGVEPARADKIYRMLIEWTLEVAPKTRIVICEPFILPFGAPTPEWIPEMQERVRYISAMAKDFGLEYVPLQETFNAALKLAPQEYWLADGVHPTTAGHALIAKTWLETVFGK